MTLEAPQIQFESASTLCHFDILVADDFVLTELAGIVDVLMIANRVCVRPMFEWTFRSLSGGYIRSRTGAIVETKALPERPEASYLFVLGNSNPDNPALSVGKNIRRYCHRRCAGLLVGRSCQPLHRRVRG